jgi:uncharacterized 2Fe-2S/4Fe-4S cluster protein (DUF4445 family)
VASVTYLPSGRRVECADGEDVFHVAEKAGIGISTACGAKATCGLCRVKIVGGEQFLSRLNDAEKKHLGNVYFINKLRLSCQATVSGGDVTVEIPGAPAAAPKRP